jgi:PAS domain S-box-containing protein
MLFVQGLDYRSLFEQCPAALGIAALDGRILECNLEFNVLLRFNRDDLLKQSIFNLVRKHQDIFQAMA